MKISINIQEDAELRAHIKDMIKGQVLSVARQEIRAIIKEVFAASVGDAAKKGQALVDTEIQLLVRGELASQGYNQPGFIKNTARELIGKEVSNFFKDRSPLQ